MGARTLPARPLRYLRRERLEAALDAGRPEEARAVLRDLGREALEEDGDWVLLYRERALEVPQPG